MKQIIFTIFLIGCLAFSASSSEPHERQQAVALEIEEKSKSLGVEAIQVGEVLRAISVELRKALQQPEVAEHQGQEYFIKKLWNKAKNAVKQVGKVVEKTAKGVITSKAADIVKKFLQEKIGAYALEDEKTYQDFRQDLMEELDRAGDLLIRKGTQLCSCRGRKHLDEQEKKFVQGIAEALVM
uniref:Putative conserved secreted protein midgut overexpressed n=1 Tax=Rhipicephalus microplus TaxID=6941 RepID=A0A6M2CHR7_RHIMP